MLDVSDEVRAEIGDDEADRLLGGVHTPDTYDCTSCRTPGDSLAEPTSTVLFVGEETAVLAFAHARCIPSQVVPVSEEQLIGAVRSISQTQGTSAAPAASALPAADPYGNPLAGPYGSAPAPHPHAAAPAHDPLRDPLRTDPYAPHLAAAHTAPHTAPLGSPLGSPLADPLTAPLSAPGLTGGLPAGYPAPQAPAPAPALPTPPARVPAPGEPAVLGVTCGLVLCGDTGHAAVVVEPTGPVGRPGSTSGTDEFLPLLADHGFLPVSDVNQVPGRLPGWSVLFAMGLLHSILQPSSAGTSAWWQAHSPLVVTEAWRNAANSQSTVIMYAAPAGTIGRQPREDMLRTALDRAAARGLLVAATLPLAGT
ncbi:hypothetical protein ACFYNO_22965 [Kitasatospora sp. NPDC006697]|uniref:hypothetical protein n=1 Tax=Kitasatospora sp. NPDC006697 TaxID=3364020 RepID=UPI0036877D13